eukprot:CAMPEP_0113559168 /NCGR_PEP_ID=MMETSP0015_2-20120614/18745_1 /TAXON_ID=2838 /ORGANISM="Odontella" /LENGTH=646 /DNA_ID=CAMNT_0000460771 /DNA_START=170 /DNA_END=2110 /DNA_ORIENTATION=+ /assembly_acc=CAM_ASM_000160
MVSSRRLSGGGGQSSGAAAACLMASAFLVDEVPHRGSAGAHLHVVADDDESCIFPSTGSLVSSVTAGPSPIPKFRRGGGAGACAGAGAGGLQPSPRRRSYNGPYVYQQRSPDASFDESECSGSVASTFTAGPSASVVGSFGYGASNAEFASSAYPSPSPQKSGSMGGERHRPRVLDDDLVSDLTTLSAPARALESRNGAATKPSSKKGGRGRGRGAIKSLSRSFRSRSPGLRNGKKPQQHHDETVSVDGHLESTKKQLQLQQSTTSSANERRRSRTRSPLRKVADSIKKKTTKKGRRRSRSEGADRRLGAAPSQELAGPGARMLLSPCASSVDPAEESYGGEDDDSVSMYSLESVGSYSTAPCSIGASSVASAPVLRTVRRQSGVGMRRVGSSASLRSSLSLLPTLIQEEDSDDSQPIHNPVRREESLLPSPTSAKKEGESREESDGIARSVERSARKSLLDRAKSGTKTFRRNRSRSRARNAKKQGDCWVQCGGGDSVSAASDITAPARIEGAMLGRPSKIKVPSSGMSHPSKLLEVSSSHAPTPAALTGRMSAEAIMSQLRAGPGASAAVRKLREQQSGLTVRGPSHPGGTSKKLSYTYIAGIPVPDYASYVEGAVGAFRQSLGVSDEDYAAAKERLLGWRYEV